MTHNANMQPCWRRGSHIYNNQGLHSAHTSSPSVLLSAALWWVHERPGVRGCLWISVSTYGARPTRQGRGRGRSGGNWGHSLSLSLSLSLFLYLPLNFASPVVQIFYRIRPNFVVGCFTQAAMSAGVRSERCLVSIKSAMCAAGLVRWWWRRRRWCRVSAMGLL